MIKIGNVKAGRVRIYKFNSFKALTKKENDIRNDKDKSNDYLLEEIAKNKDIRSIDRKYLYYNDKEGKEKENERYQIDVFEGDIVRLALKERKEAKADYQLLDEIVYMEIFHNDIMWQIIRDGILIADKKYILYSATTGQVRNTTVTLLRKDFFDNNKDALMVGLSVEYINEQGGMNTGKYLAYTALPLSSSILPEKEIDIDRCMLVKGLETDVKGMVKYIDIQPDENGQYYVNDTPDGFIEKEVHIEHTDGAGMFLPGELPSSCQIRSGFFKGAMFPFDFRLFANEVAHNTKIPDAWEDEVDVEEQDIRYIFTTSQLKMWKMYSSWEEYKRAFRENKIKISINSYANPAKETVTFAYQYLQTLPYGCDIKRLCAPAKDDLKRLHTDIEYVKSEMGYADDSETEINDDTDNEDIEDNESIDDVIAVTDNIQTNSIETTEKQSCNSIIAEALNVYPQLIYDPYIEKKIRQLVKSRRRSYRAGKIPLSGYYSYAAPDMYAFCEYLFCGESNPEGLVPKNHIYNKYYDEKGDVEHLICLRSPHLSRYEYGKRNLIKSDECREWFKYMESDTVVSCHDLLSKTLQMDWDGDEILVSDDAELWELAKDLPEYPLYYVMQQAEAQQITNEAIFDTLVKGFDNNVIGDSSNAMTKLWNAPDISEDNPLLYDDAINVYCAYSNYAIDYPKTGKNLALGEYEELYNKLVPPKEGKERFAKSEIKHPNFFIEAKGKKSKNVEKPTKSVMDRIKKYIGEGTGKLDYTYFDNSYDSKRNEFDYRMLMNNEKKEDETAKYEVDRYDNRYQRLYLTLQRRKASKKYICSVIDKEEHMKNMDVTERAGRFETFHYHCVQEIKEIFTDKNRFFNDNLAVNYLIDMEYMQHEFITSSKDILWKCFGHIILDNLQKNVTGNIVIKFRPRKAYKKAVKGDAILDKKITEKMECRHIDITKSDLSFITDSLELYKNGNPHSNDMELLYVLFCLYKEAKASNKLKDGYFVITKRKHITNYDDKSKKKKKRKIKFNMNKIMEIAGARSYVGSFDRFRETNGIEIIEDEEKEQYRIKIDIPNVEEQCLFTVRNIYNSMIYLQAYQQNKDICVCKVCGKDFIKTSNNQKTCGKSCSDVLQRLNVAKRHEKSRKTEVKEQKVI